MLQTLSSTSFLDHGSTMSARASLAAIFLSFLGILPLHAAAANSEFGATILCYHIVESPQDPRMEVSRETFRQHMRYLAMTGYNVIPLRDLYEYVAGHRHSLPRNAVVITIDDGWRSTYTEVFPEMKRRGFPFTVFVYPQIIGQTSHAMTWKQVKELSAAGVDIQSHSLSHPFLTQRRHTELSEKEYAAWLQRELVESKKILERETGRTISFIAYPYGDYDHRLADCVARAGYAGALTCDYGRVRKGSDPLRMRRVAIEKSMDFATFRRLMGAGSLRLAEMSPGPGHRIEEPTPNVVVSARIADYKLVDPKSVGMALVSVPSNAPYSYDPHSGAISVVLKEALAGSVQRAVVWATDAKSGKRIEGSWSFRLPSQELPIRPATADPEQVAPGDPRSGELDAAPGLVPPASGSHDARESRERTRGGLVH